MPTTPPLSPVLVNTATHPALPVADARKNKKSSRIDTGANKDDHYTHAPQDNTSNPAAGNPTPPVPSDDNAKRANQAAATNVQASGRPHPLAVGLPTAVAGVIAGTIIGAALYAPIRHIAAATWATLANAGVSAYTYTTGLFSPVGAIILASVAGTALILGLGWWIYASSKNSQLERVELQRDTAQAQAHASQTQLRYA